MRTRNLILASILLFAIPNFALADRVLDRTEILQIFQTLTAQPRTTWVSAGTIEATHQEYDSSTGYTLESTVVVKYDGSRFSWEIDIDSHTRTGPSGKAAGFDVYGNKQRVFVWDGQLYTRYFKSGNHAVVEENPTDTPVRVNGPLTAGLVPWGYEIFTYDELAAVPSSATEKEVDGQNQVHLRLTNGIYEIIFVLDPAKNYAVLSRSLSNTASPIVTETQCSNYQSFSGRWVPKAITIEKYDSSSEPRRLLSRDNWNLTTIYTNTPGLAAFDVSYQTDTLVQYSTPLASKALFYRCYDGVDTDSLLQQRLAILSDKTQVRNCGTTSLKYVAEQLGRDVTGQPFADLASLTDGSTSLYQLRQFARDQLSLQCLAVKTSLQTLRNLNGAKAILHLPGSQHYVVLEFVDDECIWVIDLDGNKFYYRIEVDDFRLDWPDGTALLVSNGPISLTGPYTELTDAGLHDIIGGASGNASCTDQIQYYNIEYCSEPIGGSCGGFYYQFNDVFACEMCNQSSSCSGESAIGTMKSPCIDDLSNPWGCKITGKWYSQYIRGCQ